MTEYKKAYDRICRKGLTAEILKTLVRYEPDTGQFIRLASPKRAAGGHFGFPATPSLNDNGYAFISLGRHWRFRAHQLAWLYVTGEWPQADVDHINGNRADNRWTNLRSATRTQNLQNMGIRSNNTSGLKGVSFDQSRNKWIAQICVEKNRKMLGRFDTPEAAHAAYCAAAERHFGEFARVA